MAKDPFDDLPNVASADPFADLPDVSDVEAAGTDPFMNLTDAPKQVDPAYAHYPKALARGVMNTVGGIGGFIEKQGIERLAGPAPVQSPSRDSAETAQMMDFSSGDENPFSAAMQQVEARTGVDVDEMVQASDTAQTAKSRERWRQERAKETAEERASRVSTGKFLAGYGRAVSDKTQEYSDEYFKADQRTRETQFDKQLTDDTTRAVLTAIIENAPNTALSLGAAKIMGKIGSRSAAAGAVGTSYVLESSDIFQSGMRFLEDKYGGLDKIPDYELGKLVDVSQAHGLFNAGLDAIMPANVAGNAARRKLLDKTVQKLFSGKSAKEVGGQAIKNAFLEAAPEIIQEGSSITGESRIGVKHSNAELKNRHLQAAVAGTGIGGITGTASAVSDIADRNKKARAEESVDNGASDTMPGDVEDILSGDARQSAPADPFDDLPEVEQRALPAPKLIGTPDGEVGSEAQFEAAEAERGRRGVELGTNEVAGAVQGRAPLPDVESGSDETAKEPDDLMKVIARAGGLSRGEAESQGIDPAAFTDPRSRQVFGRPLFPKAGGMTMDGLAEFLSQRGYLPEGQFSANEALDLVDRALRGEKIYSTYNAASAFEKQAAERDVDMREQSRGQAGPVDLKYRADDLRGRIAEVQKNLVKNVLGEDAARDWQPKPDDFGLSGYTREAEDVQDIAETVFDGARVMGDAWESFYESFLIQNQDLEGSAFESTLRTAIRSHENAEKPGVSGEAQPRLQGRDEIVQVGKSQAEASQAPAEPQAGKEITKTPESGHVPSDRSARPDRPETRRQDAAQRKSVTQMSPEELRRELLTDSLTGLPNRRAYEEATKKPVQAAIDLDSLKWINDEMSHESGDKALAAIGQTLRESGLEAYHLSGDEFIVQGQNRIAIENGMAEVRRRLDNAVIHFEHSDGSTTTKTGVHFSYGIGATRNEADTALSTDKASRQATGRRTARGEAPGGVERRAKGQQDNQDRPAASQEVKPPDTAEQPKQTPPQGGVSASAPEKADANAEPSAQADLFGGKSETAQAVKDADVDRQRKMDAAPPIESGEGDLFSGKSKQTDIADQITESVKASAESTKAVAEAVSGLKDEVADLRQDIASQGEQKKITDLLNDSRLSGITVKVRAVEAESGRKIVYSEKADVALRDVEERITLARRLAECLAS